MKLLVGQNLYSVEIDTKSTVRGCDGETYKNKSEILIAPNLSKDMYRYVLFHEILHAVCEHVGIQDKEKLDEETWISRVSPTLLDVLSTNTELLTTIL
jgi:Zn-dependent peptidase ImmA (M78 family)